MENFSIYLFLEKITTFLRLSIGVAEIIHFFAKKGRVSSSRINNYHSAMRFGMRVNELGQINGMASFIQEIAPDDEVESPEGGISITPGSTDEWNLRPVVEFRILLQKLFCLRVMVRRCDVSQSMIQ